MPPVYEALLLNTVVPQIQAAQAGDSYVMVVNATTPALRITQTGTGNAISVEDEANPDSSPFVVTAAGDVGIGLSSPTVKLDVVGSAKFAGSYVSFNDNGYIRTDAANILRFQPGSGGYQFRNASNSDNLAVLDASGNLGLGVTPSAWDAAGAGGPVLQIQRALLFGANTETRLIHNAYYGTGDFRYIASGVAATNYQQASGQHRWFNAPSGTAGDAISFTQAMTLDASGNLGVGATSSLKKLTVKGSTTDRTVEVIDDGSNDAAIMLQLSGAQEFTLGVDRTDNSFRIADGGALGSNDRLVIDSSGNLLVGTTSATAGAVFKVTGTVANSISHQVWTTASSTDAAYYTLGSGNVNGVATGATNAGLIVVNKDSGNLRSISAAGSLNASGADYAEYMTKAGNFEIAKGDICGIDENGKLTNVFDDAVSFVVKSTDPSYVGGDTWFVEEAPSDEAELPAFKERMESARQMVDRIAFAGQVPVNVIGATAGQYIVPVNDNGAIKGIAVNSPTFEQYQIALGKVIAIESDGRARIIVKVV
jgi:hypothetical protein